MSQDDANLNAPKGGRQAKAIAAMLESRTLREAAEASGVPHGTLRRWMSRKSFREKIGAARGRFVEHAALRLSESTSSAVAKLAELLDSQNDCVSLGAATAILDRTAKLTEHLDLRKQIEELAAKLEQIEQNGKAQEAEK